jgi:pimeloyl-ACP methyl ester carboxylesterase
MSIKLVLEVVGNGPPVIVLHGLFGTGRNWAHIAQALSHSYRVYLPDARNHDASPWAKAMSYPDMALDMLAPIEREQLLQPFLIGHSMGGKTAMALALEHQQVIGGEAVIDIAPERYGDQFSPYATAMRSINVAGATSLEELHQSLANSLDDSSPVDFLMQNLRRHEKRFDWRINLMANAMFIPDLCDFPQQPMGKHSDGPALFVAGADSDYVRAESHAEIRRLFPHERPEHIDDAAHWAHADQPEALVHALHRWLRELTGSCVGCPLPAPATRRFEFQTQ